MEFRGGPRHVHSDNRKPKRGHSEMKRGFVFAGLLAMSLFAAQAARAQEKAAPPVYTWLSERFPDYTRYDSPVLTISDSGLSADQGIVDAQLTLVQSPQGVDSVLGLAVAFHTKQKWNFNTVRDYGKFGTRYRQPDLPVVIPTLNGGGYNDTGYWNTAADGGKTWPVNGGVFILLDRLNLKTYEISGTDLVLSLSDYDATDKVFRIRIPAAYLSRFLASIPNDRRLVPEELRGRPMGFGVHFVDLDERVQSGMKLPGGALQILGVLPGTVADRAGLKNYDVLIRFGDRPLKTMADLADAVHATAKGTVVPLTVWRDARAVTLQAQF
ncbi:PDZ domain-containing protein [Burkholderia cepacia]|uniref:PDZ domain-containing protein n=1 Tax=Burkholderia cepacia TaxID=292 RepID=UPI0011B63986|nr:PDZ domain-containing protein [Burkholderia cepacia]MCA7894094.1 PDZ domain-containing protein [Burkholderia cepacia]MDN7888338.1 PDZ domain-containing protein [Burkholderia cepacia]